MDGEHDYYGMAFYNEILQTNIFPVTYYEECSLIIKVPFRLMTKGLFCVGKYNVPFSLISIIFSEVL